MNSVVVGLGTNIEADLNIQTARERLPELGEIRKETDFVTTEPVGDHEQPWFKNGAVLLATPLSLEELKRRLRDIEESMGRPRDGDRSGPRTIDLDILVWNGTIVDPDVYSRGYLLDALRVLCPEVVGTGK